MIGTLELRRALKKNQAKSAVHCTEERECRTPNASNEVTPSPTRRRRRTSKKFIVVARDWMRWAEGGFQRRKLGGRTAEDNGLRAASLRE